MTKSNKTQKCIKRPIKKCATLRCTNHAVSPRAKFCSGCFKKVAASASLKRKRYGGNSNAKGVRGNCGGGNDSAKGVYGNNGNTTVGKAKKSAGKRSALRRSTKMLLLVKNPWLDLILSGRKTWEIRDTQTKQRGKIHLALSGAGGRIVGQCHITRSFAFDKDVLAKKIAKHRIKDLAIVKYARPHVWELSRALRYKQPFVYSHPQGATKWVKL